MNNINPMMDTDDNIARLPPQPSSGPSLVANPFPAAAASAAAGIGIGAGAAAPAAASASARGSAIAGGSAADWDNDTVAIDPLLKAETVSRMKKSDAWTHVSRWMSAIAGYAFTAFLIPSVFALGLTPIGWGVVGGMAILMLFVALYMRHRARQQEGLSADKKDALAAGICNTIVWPFPILLEMRDLFRYFFPQKNAKPEITPADIITPDPDLDPLAGNKDADAFNRQQIARHSPTHAEPVADATAPIPVVAVDVDPSVAAAIAGGSGYVAASSEGL